MTGADARKIDQVLAQPGQGVAVFACYDGSTVVTVSYGTDTPTSDPGFPVVVR
jgi:hypothetical protein